MYRVQILIAICIAPLIAVACASYDKRIVDYGTIHDYSSSSTVDGITLAAQLLQTESEVTAVFDENLISKEYYPLKLMIENNSGGRILILRESIALVDLSSNMYRPIDAAIVAEDFEDNAIAYGLLGFGVFSYASAKDANLERQADYSAKQMQVSQVIYSGHRRGSFLYFKLPKRVVLGSLRLQIEVERMDDEKITHIIMDIKRK